MPFPLFVALRFLREGRQQTLLILAGVAVGVGVIVFVSALIGGLQESLIDRTLGSQPHVVVEPPEELPRSLASRGEAIAEVRVERSLQRTQSIAGWQQLRASIERQPGVVAVSPIVAGAAFAEAGRFSRAVALRGVEPDSFDQVVHIRSRLVAGSFAPAGRDAVVGIQLARDLGLAVGDKLRVATTEVGSEVLTVTGIFDLGNRDVNERWVLVSLRQAQSLLALPGEITSLEVKVGEIFSARAIAERIDAATGMTARSWMETNAQLLSALQSQAGSSTMIQAFVVVAVALGIASVLVVSVVQRSRQIGILAAMGATRGEVTAVFLVQGALLGLVGSIVGIVLGAALAALFQRVAGNLFPILLTPGLVLRTALLATVTGIVSAVVPARRAARLDPAAAIHGD